MKKVIISSGEKDFLEGTFKFIGDRGEQDHLSLVGVFLPEPMLSPAFAGREEDNLKINVASFEDLCRKYGVGFKVCTDREEMILSRISRESRFADLLIAGMETLYKEECRTGHRLNLKTLLHATECPVLLTPARMYDPKRILLSYDGSASSVFAIRQFIALFPDLCKRETTLVYEGKKMEFPFQFNIKELLERNFPQLDFLRLDPEDDECFQSGVNDIDQPMVVAGSFGAAGSFPLFRKGFITDLIRQNHLLVFLARK